MCSCCKAIYFGESEKHLYICTLEHLGITPLIRKGVKNPKSYESFTLNI